MPAPNWHEVEERLFHEGKSALLQFAEEHPDEICSFFAYGWIPMDGDFSLFLDTPHNALHEAQDDQQYALQRREKMLQHANSWQRAHSYLSQDVVEYASNVDLFAYAPYREVYFDGWQEFVSSDVYPKGRERADDYMEGNTRIVIWHVFKRLIESGIFSQMHLSSPFRLGYQFHDDALTVLYILNWPTISTPDGKK